MADAVRHGTTMRGERSAVAVLTEDNVHEIRKRIAGGEAVKTIAQSYGVKPVAIYCIRSGKSWAWLEEAELEGWSTSGEYADLGKLYTDLLNLENRIRKGGGTR